MSAEIIGSSSGRLSSRLTVAVLANAMTWIAIWSWRGMVEEPLEFIGPALVAAVLIALTGALLRTWRMPAYVVLLLQIVVVLVWFHHHQEVSTFANGWIPTPHGISAITDQIRTGASAINTYAAPVKAARMTAPMYLLGLALLLLLAVDLIAAGLRRPTWAGLPILVALTVPISVLDGGLALPVFVGTSVLFVMLLAAVENEHVLSWGQVVTGRRRRDAGSNQVVVRTSAQIPALKIGLLAAAGAMVLPVLVPLSHGLLENGPANQHGRGVGEPVRLRNPMADLRRDLVQNDHLPLLDAQTDSTDPTYLRTTVLDSFNGTAWVPGARDLPQANIAQGRMPNPVGVPLTTPGTESQWELQTTPDFITSWLPVPYVTRSIKIDQGDWRYDPRTLDLANTDPNTPNPVTYRLTGFAPTYDPARLETASVAPDDIRIPMTKVPRLTEPVARIARQVTAAGRTDYAKAVLLQNWFRNDGGFRYSLEPASGNGMAQLERFITSEKIGYCEQFAAAMAVMARTLGIPARVVVGFLAPTKLTEGTYLYTSDDLHAWPELYFRGSGWVRFEPTPAGRTGTAPRWTRPNAVVPTPTTPTANPTQTTDGPTPTKKPIDTGTTRTDQGNPPASMLRIAVVLLFGAGLTTPALLRRNQRRRRLARQDDPRREVENLWRELRATSIDLRIPWPEGRSPRTAARILCHRVNASPEDAADLRALVAVLEEARYRGRYILEDEVREQCLVTVSRWAKVLFASAPPGRARLARVLPKSVFAARKEQTSLGTQAPIHPDPNSLTEVG